MHRVTKGIIMKSRNILQITHKPQRRYVVSPLLTDKTNLRNMRKDLQKMTLSTTDITGKSKSNSSPFKTWPVKMVESKGDYREEAHLEELISGPLYSYQKTLPPLPIPTIEETISTFLPTALPLCESEEEVNNLKEACRAFPNQAAHLHEKLLARKDEMDNSSWLQLWWNTEGYLKGKHNYLLIVKCFSFRID